MVAATRLSTFSTGGPRLVDEARLDRIPSSARTRSPSSPGSSAAARLRRRSCSWRCRFSCSRGICSARASSSGFCSGEACGRQSPGVPPHIPCPPAVLRSSREFPKLCSSAHHSPGQAGGSSSGRENFVYEAFLLAPPRVRPPVRRTARGSRSSPGRSVRYRASLRLCRQGDVVPCAVVLHHSPRDRPRRSAERCSKSVTG